MINDSHSPHFGANGFEYTRRETIFITEEKQRGDEFPRGVFQFNENCQKYPLLVFVIWEKNPRQIIEATHSLNFVIV